MFKICLMDVFKIVWAFCIFVCVFTWLRLVGKTQHDGDGIEAFRIERRKNGKRRREARRGWK